MALPGRKTLQSSHARNKHIDKIFERIAQTLLIVYALFVLATWLSHRPSFAITHITIDGLHAVDKAAIGAIAKEALGKRLLYRIQRDNALLYPTDGVLETIRTNYPRIASVAAAFDPPHALHISVHEYTPSLLYCFAGEENGEASASSTLLAMPTNPSQCYFADERGYIFSKAPEYSGFPFLTIIASTTQNTASPLPVGTFMFERSEYERILHFVAALREMNVNVHAVALFAEHDIRLSSNMPWDILWSTTKDPKESATNLKLVRDSLADSHGETKDVSVIDLRFGNKIFYK